MSAPNAAELLNVVGFITGAVLYAMLLALVLRSPTRDASMGSHRDRLPLATAILGLIWNIGELLTYGLPRIGLTSASVVLSALSFPALGLLAAVVVHSVARTLRGGRALSASAYGSAVAAGLLHVRTIFTGDPASSSLAFTILTVSFSVLIVPLAILSRRQLNGPRAVWMLGLALFAISAAHLGQFHGDASPWVVELAGHHAAIPLAFAILYQDYRFALADLFLKQALTILVLVAVAFGGYSAVASSAGGSSLAVGALLTLWIATALLYPWLRRQIVRFVDAVLLDRMDYGALRATIAQEIVAEQSVDAVLDIVCSRLRTALNARRVEWHVAGELPSTAADAALSAPVPTADAPGFVITVHDLSGGRRLLSDDEALADVVAGLAGRRIDSLRLTTERYERRLREEEMEKLAAEAELKALRAQINPHFLFNALTTIAYLVEVSPQRAVGTLMRLTALLRGSLRSDGEFTTLGREVELVEHYLDIERARFEERLRVRIDVPPSLRNLRVPALILQPLVENAIKHGIGPSAAGGDVEVLATKRDESLRVVVRNSGAPLGDLSTTAPGRHIGLDNVERRLQGHYNGLASLSLRRLTDGWTVAEIILPLEQRPTTTNAA